MPRLRRGFSLLLALTLVLSWSLVVGAQTDDGPSVTVGDQIVRNGIVVVERVVAAQDGWIVIHSGADGIGPVIGQAPVSEGVNEFVEVEIDASAGTPNLYAMLHVDEGEAGTYEFPGADGPVVVDGEVVAPIFAVIYVGRVTPQPVVEEEPAEEAEAAEESEEAEEAEEAEGEEAEGEAEAAEGEEMMSASVTVADQDIVDGIVMVAEVVAAQDGWIVIHRDQDGSFAEVIGQSAVSEGTNTDVRITIDTAMATETLYAMLHVDEGEVGTYEFPGPDGPVVVDGNVVSPAFMVTNFADMGSMEEEAMEEEMMAENIVATAMAAGSFETLIAAAQAAGLADALAEGEALTVFAPTDDAFMALPDGALDGLLADPEGALRDVLLYHVVPMAAMAGDLSDGMMLETLQGGMLTVSISDDGTVMIDGATVVTADIKASNGIIHVIDSVLMPSDMMMMDDEAMDDEMADDEAMDEEMADDEAMDDEAMDEEMADDEAMDDEAMDEEMADEAPHMLPITGGSAEETSSSLPWTAGLALLALAGGALALRRRSQAS